MYKNRTMSRLFNNREENKNNGRKIWCWIGIILFIIMLICIYNTTCNKNNYTYNKLDSNNSNNSNNSEEKVYFPKRNIVNEPSRCFMEGFNKPNITGLKIVENFDKTNNGFSINRKK